MKLFKCSFLYVFFSSLLNFNAFADPTTVDKIIDDLVSTSEITPEVIIKLLQLQASFNTENLSNEIEAVKTIRDEKYGRQFVGQIVKDYRGFYYPNGQIVKDYRGFYYPNGQIVKDYRGFYYPNGQIVKDYRGFYDPSGSKRDDVYKIEWPPKESAKIIESPKVVSIPKKIAPELTPITSKPSIPTSKIKCEIKPTGQTIEAELLNIQLVSKIRDLVIQFVSERNPLRSEKPTEEEIKNIVGPKFIAFSKTEHSLSESAAKEYFDWTWSCDETLHKMLEVVLK